MRPSLALQRQGSSAHAEMRPRRMRCMRPRSWFLRSRGDAPAGLRAALDRGAVPPLTRRCARQRRRRSDGVRGSSAHAEMRRARSARRGARSRFLRSRGDAPKRDVSLARTGRVPPLTRRCAASRHSIRFRVGGSSAHAEMRLERSGFKDARTRFLRSRGDAPESRDLVSCLELVPPLTRRCAAEADACPRETAGSSAHAEMRRAADPAPCVPCGFLRSRGDAPCGSSKISILPMVPPLTRRCAR